MKTYFQPQTEVSALAIESLMLAVSNAGGSGDLINGVKPGNSMDFEPA